MSRIVLHFGGNGHSTSRLDQARWSLARRADALELVDIPYPGFEGRPGADSYEGFLEAVSRFVEGSPDPPSLGYASGIGALIALGLRAKGGLVGVPLIFQGAVLWGLEGRRFPRAMRAFPPARVALKAAFGLGAFRRRFARKQFLRPHGPATLAAFFEGYRACSSFGDFFDWLSPERLRSLERDFLDRPEALEGVTAWVGGLDHVVGLEEIRLTERALGVAWPVVEFPTWGHYPMIDVSEEWADALCRALATA